MVVDGSMFHSSQWFHVPRGASGSSMMSTRLLALSGMPDIPSAGFTLAPSAVNFAGIIAPSAKAGLVIFIASPATSIEGDIMQRAHTRSFMRAQINAGSRRGASEDSFAGT